MPAAKSKARASSASHYSVHVFWSDEDDAYVAVSPEFPGLSGVDAKVDRAVAELREAMEMALDTFKEQGAPIPEPHAPPSFGDFSGQLRLRMPRSVHAELATRAESEGVSLNTLAVTYIAKGLGRRR